MLVDPGLIFALVAAAVLIGATGTWSPCGFSMVETIGPNGHTGGRRVTLAACATFLPGAVAGAVLTFGGLALLGSALPGGAGWLSYGVAIAVALVAAVAEARGARIAPQIRRQLPEHWRRVMPMPVAAALYGVLLGLGFTTFVLTFGVWALAGISLALGDPAAGLAIGLGFGVGRALPIVALAPLAHRDFGRAAITLMAERPGLYRAIRLGDAAALLGAAGALLFAGAAEADSKAVKDASDPAVAGSALVFADGPDDAAVFTDGRDRVDLRGTDPGVASRFVAVIDRGAVAILGRPGFVELDRFPADGVDAVAISDRWVAYRTRSQGRDQLSVRPLSELGQAGGARGIDGASDPNQIGMPGLDGSTLIYAIAKQRNNRIVRERLSSGKRQTVLKSREHGLSNPSVRGNALLYVRSARGGDELRLRGLGGGGKGRKLLSRTGPRLWSTALSADRAYVTVLRGSAPQADITSVRR